LGDLLAPSASGRSSGVMRSPRRFPVTRHTLLACTLLTCGFPAALLAAPDGAGDNNFGGAVFVNWWNAGKITVHDVAMTEAMVIGVVSYVADSGAQDPRLHWQGF